MKDRNNITSVWKTYRKISIFSFKSLAAFMIIFSAIYFVFIPLDAVIRQLIAPVDALFQILLGFGLLSLLVLIFLISHSRIGALLMSLELLYWIFVPSNWIISNWSKMKDDFSGTYYSMWVILIITALISINGLVNFFGETIYLAFHEGSPFWGPWFSNFKAILLFRRLSSKKKRKIKNGFLVLGFLMVISITGLMTFFKVYQVPVEIRPKDYPVKFNFWATPFLNGYYNSTVRHELNKHHVNLDLTFSVINNHSVELLKEWESELPNITYRIVLTPIGNLTTLPDVVKQATEILMECEKNGTLDQWLGFCFDIEGDVFNYKTCYDDFDDAVKLWDEVFDYIDQKSVERGKTIEMECVSILKPSVDVPFDGDTDLQKDYSCPSYTPERFTSYAPMVYRCWYQGDIPYGSPMDPDDPWPTSYEIYSSLELLSRSVPSEKVGIYLGITNCSCYGRDLPQPEKISWGEKTGLGNLIRDVLISKHFGLKEVTFFLVWTVIENNYSMGGVFDSYGIDFLDVMNDSVNGQSSPEKFYIYYNYGDSVGPEDLAYDWVYDFSRFSGILDLILIGVGAVFTPWLFSLVQRRIKKMPVNEPE
ncbi:MAG: hypothetical protein ACTSVI_09265 [Promethearchaeota archaeon]